MQPCENSTYLDGNTLRFLYVLNGPCMTTVVVIGLAGNFLCLKIFLLDRRKYFDSLRPFLAFIAVYDVLLIVTSWLVFSLPSLVLHTGMVPLYGDLVYVYYILYPVSNIAYMGCALGNVLVALERYAAICHPLAYQTFRKKSRIRITLLCTTLVTVVLNIPKFIEYGLGQCEKHGEILPTIFSRLAGVDLYVKGYLIPTELLCITFGPIVVLTIVTVRIVIAIRAINIKDAKSRVALLQTDTQRLSLKHLVTERNTFSSFKKVKLTWLQKNESFYSHFGLTRMLVILLLKFIVCDVLPSVLDIMHAILSQRLFAYGFYHVVADCNNLLVVIQSSTNFFVYFFCSRNFRHACLHVFCSECCQNIVLSTSGFGVSDHERPFAKKFNNNEYVLTDTNLPFVTTSGTGAGCNNDMYTDTKLSTM